MKKQLLISFCLIFLSVSCEKEPIIEDPANEPQTKAKKERKNKPSTVSQSPIDFNPFPVEDNLFDENLRVLLDLEMNDASECSPTELAPALLTELVAIASDPIADQNFNLYNNLNRRMAFWDTSEQYFGKDGEYTNLMNKRIRELERFWDMPDQIEVRGQHSESLNDRDKLAFVLHRMIMDDVDWEMAYLEADRILSLNESSPNLPESPLFSIDGFTTSDGLIIIGDGLIEIIASTGLDPETVWTGILAHEWAHQIQLNHIESWFPDEDPDEPIPHNYLLELEADFFAAYYLTHKRGATYNWKGVEQFLDLFFQLGDCTVNRPSHHGTPNQRMRASLLGSELANDAQKKGHILDPNEVHQAFLESQVYIIEGSR